MLRFRDFNLKLISDSEKYQIVESMISGDFPMICKGYVEANNKFLELYDPNKQTSYIIYLDANDLYEDSAIKLFLTKILDWVSSKYLI